MWLHHKKTCFKTRSTRAEENRNKQGTLVNNVEKNNQKIFKQYSSKIFFKTKNAKDSSREQLKLYSNI